jgi:serine/threonine protein kinase
MIEKIDGWEVIREIGTGGQGQVYLVCRDDGRGVIERMVHALKWLIPGTNTPEKLKPLREELALALDDFVRGRRMLGALKKLKDPNEEGKARLRLEAEVYETISDSHLLKIVEKKLPDDWIVTEFQPNGTLESRLSRFKGDVLGSLKLLRPIVRVLAEMHSKGFTHRDVKPGNLFIRQDGELVLGDAGLAFYDNDKDNRVTKTYENVGTRDYMPAWAMSRRVEIKPSFDVFSVGKVLWAMIAGIPACPLWYVRETENELKNIFPDDPLILWVTKIFDMTVVERETDCLGNASELLRMIDETLNAAARGGQPIGKSIARLCRVCGAGSYRPVSKETDIDEVRRFGLQPYGETLHLIYSCDNCGHIQIFYSKEKGNHQNGSAEPPKAWRKSK